MQPALGDPTLSRGVLSCATTMGTPDGETEKIKRERMH